MSEQKDTTMRSKVYNADIRTQDAEPMNVNVWAFNREGAVTCILARFPDANISSMFAVARDDAARAGTVLVLA